MDVIADESLAALGNVPHSYVHEWRIGAPAAPLVLPGAIFKWYHVHRAGEPVAGALDAEARALVAATLAAGGWDVSYGLNFAVLHQSTQHAFLLLCIWRGHQEMWERLYYKELHPPGPFLPAQPEAMNTPAACVWELGPITHERMAWHRYLFTARTEADKRAWLADTFSGQV